MIKLSMAAGAALAACLMAAPAASADPIPVIAHNICNELTANPTPSGLDELDRTMAREGNDADDIAALVTYATSAECPQHAQLVKRGRKSTHR